MTGCSSYPLGRGKSDASCDGLGFVTSITFIFLVGVFMSSWLGASVLGLGEWFIKRMPFIRHIYNASKQISSAISPGSKLFIHWLPSIFDDSAKLKLCWSLKLSQPKFAAKQASKQADDISFRKGALLFPCGGSTSLESKADPMATRSGRNFIRRLTDNQRDGLLLKIVEQLESMDTRSESMDTWIRKLEDRGKAFATDKADEEDTIVEETNTADKEEQAQNKQSFGDWVKEYLESSSVPNKVDTARDITKKVKVEVPNFEGKTDPTVFSDWLARIEEYFDWYDMDDERRVRFAKMKLVLLANVWWAGIEGDIMRLGQPPISSWQEMKAKLREKYMPPNYLDKLCDKLTALKQGNVSVSEYMQKFDELKTRSRIVEDPRQTLARFKVGLRPDIKREMIWQPVYSVEHAFQVALDLEEYLEDTQNSKYGLQSSGTAPQKHNEMVSKVGTGAADTKPSSSKMTETRKCFKCGEPGHMGFQCPKKNLHIRIEHVEETESNGKVGMTVPSTTEFMIYLIWTKTWIL